MNNKLEDFINATKLGELLYKKEKSKRSDCIITILAVIGAIAAVAGIAYAVFNYLSPDYLEDFDDDFDEEYEVVDSSIDNGYGDKATKTSDEEVRVPEQ